MDPFQISSTFCLWLITLASSDKFSRINTHFSMLKLQGLVDLPHSDPVNTFPPLGSGRVCGSLLTRRSTCTSRSVS
jgi:hypothetical protein